jgi:chromate reductase, NAD(P)H dehydrogenase (quinone)
MPTVVTISGTSRPDNYTSVALEVVNARLRERGAEVIYFDARELTLSFPGEPTTLDAKRMREAVKAADAVVLASPEYHGSFAAMTKLIVENLGFPSALQDKPMSLLGVASGRIGAIKTIEQLRGVCAHVGAVVLPGAVSVAGVVKAFDDEGNCTDEAVLKMLQGLADHTLKYIDNYVCPRYILEAQVRKDEGDAEPWATEM